MKALKYLLFFTLLGLGGTASAQDIHFSMFDMAPLNLNAGYTGLYSGTFRIGGIYRSQWQGLGMNAPTLGTNFTGFKTPSAYVDVPFGIRSPKNVGDLKHWAGIGINFFNDQVDRLSTMRAELSFAYHIGLGQRGNTRISLGVKGGITQQRIKDVAGYVFEDELERCPNYPNCSGIGSLDDANIATDAATAPDFSAGLVFTHKGTGWGLQLGGSVNHFTQPKVNFLNDEYKFPMNIIGTARLDFSLGKKLTLRPMFFMQYMAKAIDMNAQGVFAIHFNNTKDANLLLGGGYRIGDAAFGRVGFEFKGLIFGAAYDINVSSLSFGKNSGYNGTNPRGMGFELGLSYIAKIYKDLKVDDILYNPRF